MPVRRSTDAMLYFIINLFRARKCLTLGGAVERAKSVFRSFLIKYASDGRVRDADE